ncbi:MAG TPA: hypothetical protein VFT22_40590 [Kofleriaceae bacterium]|nr:hypothetical protein [Kofleriaceae bacterium]
MARRTADTALGFRAHTGWAAVVALAGPADAPRVIDRRRIELTDETDLEAVQIYHAAAEQPLAKARWLVEAAHEATAARTRRSIEQLLASLGVPVRCAGLVAGNARIPDALDKILASHALIHAAEGELFRGAIAGACAACKLPVTGFAGNALSDHARQALGLPPGKLRERLAALGRGLGPPWGQDQKESALVAWLALALE